MGHVDLYDDPKRRVILESARRHFMTEGYAAAGMEAIARDATVSTATLYGYFSSKADLFKHVIEDAASSFADRITATTHASIDPADQLRGFTVAYARFMADPFVRAVFRLVASERRRFEPTAQYFFQRGREDFGGVLMGILARMRSEGRLKVGKLSWAAGQLMGMVEHPIFLVPMVTGDEVVAERNIEQICDDAIETFLARYGVPEGLRSGKKSFADPGFAESVTAET